MSEAPVRKRSADVVNRVYGLLREKAIHYDLRPGEHVNELALASELSVSRTPIREALNRLVSEGMMTFVPNKGFYCRPIDIDVVRNLFEVRSGLELIAVRLVCDRAADADLDRLAVEWEAVKTASKSYSVAEIAGHDEGFHEKLAALSGNPELCRILADLGARIRFVRYVAMEHPHYREITFDEHHAILAALKRRDADAAVTLMERHISITLGDIERIAKETIAKIYLKKG